MNPGELNDKIALVSGIFETTYGAAWSLLAALAVTALCFASLRALILGDVKDPVAWFGRTLLVLAVLGYYRELFETLLSASEGLCAYFSERAGMHEYFEDFQAAQVMFEQQHESTLDRMLGVMQGGLLTTIVSVTYYLEFMVFRFVVLLTAVFASLLYVLGPLLVVAGVLPGAATLKQWFGSVVQVLLWPAVPPFLMLMVVAGSGNALQTDNLAFVITQNLLLCMLGLITPLIVAFILGRGGVSTFAMAATGLATAGITGAARNLAPQVSRALHGGVGATASITTKGDEANAPDSTSTARRPGDASADADESPADTSSSPRATTRTRWSNP